MKLINNSTRNYMAFNIILKAGKDLDTEDEKIAKILLKQNGVEEYIDKKEVEKLKKEIQKLKAKETKGGGKEPEVKTKNTKKQEK